MGFKIPGDGSFRHGSVLCPLINKGGVAFLAHVILVRGEKPLGWFWVHRFCNKEDGYNGPRDWVERHFDEYDDETLRELLKVPADGDYQVLFRGHLEGWQENTPDSCDYDEDFVAYDVEMKKLPDDHPFLSAEEELADEEDADEFSVGIG